MRRVIFDLDCLLSFVVGVDMGSFAKAANRLGRSTSAVSAQLKKLEQQAGKPLLRKAGRGLCLTDAGETLLSYARRLLDLNDEAALSVRDAGLEGWVRLGMQEDFGEALLPQILGSFARAHPQVRIDARIARNTQLLEGIASNQLDLALAWVDCHAATDALKLGEVPMRWLGPAKHPVPWSASEPLPLMAFEPPCLFRSAATAALDKTGIPWRSGFTSPSLGGIWAAVGAGLGLTVRTAIGIPDTVRILDEAALGLPALPRLSIVLHRSNAVASDALKRLTEILEDRVSNVL
jgi:DNA-binding transcriptional LysR family regulator